MWSVTMGHELYVFRNGELVYKRWTKNGKKTQPSLLYNVPTGFPNQWIV